MQACNEQPDIHERFMEMCGKVAGRWRTILGSSPEEMDVPIKVDEELYFEGKFDTEAMLNMLEKKVLEPAGVDYSSIKIRYMAKRQEQANGIEPVPEQDVLEHEEQEQHVPVQTMKKMDGIKTPSLWQVWSFSYVHFPNVKIDCIKEMGKL